MIDGGVNEVQDFKAFSKKKKREEKNSSNRKGGSGFDNWPSLGSGSFSLGYN